MFKKCIILVSLFLCFYGKTMFASTNISTLSETDIKNAQAGQDKQATSFGFRKGKNDYYKNQPYNPNDSYWRDTSSFEYYKKAYDAGWNEALTKSKTEDNVTESSIDTNETEPVNALQNIQSHQQKSSTDYTLLLGVLIGGLISLGSLFVNNKMQKKK